MESEPKFAYLCLRLCASDDESPGTKEQENDLWRSEPKDQAREERVLIRGVGVVVVVELAKFDRRRQTSARDNVLDAKIRKAHAEAGLLEDVHDRATGKPCVGGCLCTSADDIARAEYQRRRPRLRQAHRRSGKLVRVELEKLQSRCNLL